ncbi:DNA cytosine methyltransferase [Vibrio tubiashii]|uniref:DNA cytosine methyltransferase n=1 Tax=Vibrio tubiashii TaxID=29498 RepID=UPI001EFCC15E|nr:DNA cytosine methyltransferase [Vibrio tubiashii]MCG9576080.1 DNA cytosine methyltransferase [Vibrio tubiashii]
MNTANVYIPHDFASKRLKITKYPNGKRKIQISSNWLPLFKFEKGVPVVEQVLSSNDGYEVLLAEEATQTNSKRKRIYQRTYSKRVNNPLEVLYETTSKKILDVVIPSSCEFVHIIFQSGRLVVKPWFNALAQRIEKFKQSDNKLSVFAALTSGIDAYCCTREGFAVNSLLECRPQAKRDKCDLTETGALTAISNVSVQQLFNEDINYIDVEFVKQAVEKNPSSLLTISLECCEFSNCKSNKHKEGALEDLSSSLDMLFDGYRLIDALQPPMVLLEQVSGFGTSSLGKAWNLRLKRMGYTVYEMSYKASQLSGITHRPRYFSFATSLPSQFTPPPPEPANTNPLWGWLIEPYLGQMRDVSHSKSLQDGKACGRLRTITETTTIAPTLLRSQQRMAKDSIVCETPDGRFLWLTEEQERMLMSVPESFSLANTSKTIASEILGQAVDVSVYEKLIRSVRTHIELFINSVSSPNSQLSLV